jgi:type I restriction enzyme, S subunit
MNWRTLKDVAQEDGIVGGPFGSNLVGKDYTARGVPVIRGGNMLSDCTVGGDFVYVTEDKFRRDLARNTASAGDLVFTQRGSLGQVARIAESDPTVYVISQSQMRLTVDRGSADASYVLYACRLQSFHEQVHALAIRTGVPHLNLGLLKQLRIPWQPLPRQRAIAEVLGALDDKIAANRRASDRARSLAIAVVESHAELCEASCVASIARGTLAPESMDETGVTHFSLPAFDRGYAAVEQPSDIKSAKQPLLKPTVLVSKLNPRIPRIWPVDELPAAQPVASTEFVSLEPSEGVGVGELWAALSSPRFTVGLLAHVAGTTGSHQRVRPADVLSVPITDVRLLSDSGRDLARTLCRVVNQRTDENQQLAATRDELLPLLMSGRITVKDAERRVEGEV